MSPPAVGSIYSPTVIRPHKRYDATKVDLTEDHLLALEYSINGLKRPFSNDINPDHLLGALQRSFAVQGVRNSSREVNILKATLLLRIAAESLAPNPAAMKFLEVSNSEEKLS